MKASKDAVTSVGLTVLYEPDKPQSAVLDVVFISGFGGHPARTWTYKPTPATPVSPRTPKSPKDSAGRIDDYFRGDDSLRKTGSIRTDGSVRTVLRKNSNLNPSLKSTSKLTLKLSTDELRSEANKKVAPEVFWPLDILPESCPTIRVVTWGCHTIVTHGKLPRNQNDIFAHAEDLLLELTILRDETRSTNRPIVFVTHSLGGIILKEALRRAEADIESQVRDILPSTTAVMFFACPHRASEHGKLSDAIRSMAGITLKIDPDDQVLQELTGANGFEIELCRGAFVRIWNDYNFKVKTFQEQHSMDPQTGDTPNDLFTRIYSSSLGDVREQAEAFDGNHLDLCKFASGDERDYKSFLAALSIYIRDELDRKHELTLKEKECLRTLLPSALNFKETQPMGSYPGTCLWLYDVPEFRAWHHRKDGSKNKILWIKGSPGSGKTILLKSLRNRVEKQWSPNGSSFIWSVAEGRDLDSVFFLPTQFRRYSPNPAGVYRSLLGQLFNQDPSLRTALMALYKRNQLLLQPMDDAQVASFFIDDYIEQKVETPIKRTFIFVDAADDCGVLYLQDLVYYLAQLAHNSDFSICIASNHHLDVTQENAIEIVMKEYNGDDILRYINLNLIAEWEDRNVTVNQIAAKAGGVFLWAEIVVNILNLAIEEGAMQDLIEDTIADLPGDIEGLYEWLLSGHGPEEKEETLILMQWVILASEPMRLNDLRVAVRLTRPWHPTRDKPYMALSVDRPLSTRDLRKPGTPDFDSPYQFHRWVRRRSVGLLELKPLATKDGTTAHEPLGLQRVQVIHESVRTFFLKGRGFRCLAGDAAASLGDFADVSHYALLRACFTYLNMTDFESLGRGGLSGATAAVAAAAASPTSAQEESKSWRKNVVDQRNMVMSSYPFLQYAVENLLFHLLEPRYFRYFVPQRELLRALSGNRCRIWRRWTALLGESDPAAMLERCASAQDLLSPVYGARSRLERLFRKLNTLAAQEALVPPTAVTMTPKSPLTPRSPMSISDKWFWPLTPNSAMAEAAELAPWGSPGAVPKSPRTPKPSRIPRMTKTPTPLGPMSPGSERLNFLADGVI